MPGFARQREGEVIAERQWSEQIGWNNRANERENAIGRHRGRKAAVVDGNRAVVAEIGAAVGIIQFQAVHDRQRTQRARQDRRAAGGVDAGQGELPGRGLVKGEQRQG